MIKYRNLRRSDFSEVQSVALKCWLTTYQDIYKEKTIRRTISKYYSAEGLEKGLKKAQSKDAKFIVVLDDEKIVGFTQVSKGKYGWEVFRIYLLTKHRGKGIGSQLIKKCEKFLKEQGVRKYVIYPHVKNKLAKRFYKKMGFLRNVKKDKGSTSPCYEKSI